MNVVSVIAELWLLLTIAMLVGRRLVTLLPNKVQHELSFYISPILGLAVLILLATLYGWLAPFNNKTSILLIILLGGLSFVLEKNKSLLVKDTGWLLVFAILCAAPILAPIFRYGGYNPFTDIFTYLVQAQWLQEHAFTEKVITSGNYPALTQVALYQITGSRMGGSFLLGFVQSLFAIKWSYYAYTPTVASALVTGCLALGGIVRHVVPMRRMTILAIALLPSITMNGFIYGAEWGFYPQTLGLSLALGICAIFPYLTKIVLQTRPGFKKLVIYSLPMAVCTSGLLFAYNEPFPIFAVGFLGYLLIVALNNRQCLAKLLEFITIFVMEVLVLVNYEAIRIFINIYQTLGISNGFADIGWPILWLPIQFLAFTIGMKSPFRNIYLSYEYLFSTLGAGLIFLAMAVTLIIFMRNHPKRRENIIFLACIEFVLLIFFVKFRYLSPDKTAIEVGHTFLQFKIAKYLAPFMLASLGIFSAYCYHYFKQKRRLFVITYFIVLTVGFAAHYVFAKNYSNYFLNSVAQRHDPFSVLLNLRQALSNIPNDEVIYVDLGWEKQHKLRQMVAYILYDRKIASDYRDDGYILGRLPESEQNMSKSGAKIIIYMHNAVATNPNDMRVGPFVIRKH